MEVNKNWSFKKMVKVASQELWEEGVHLFNWPKDIKEIAWEINLLLEEDPNMSFDEAYDLVMDY